VNALEREDTCADKCLVAPVDLAAVRRRPRRGTCSRRKVHAHG